MKADQFIYVVGEHQSAIFPENAEILAFTRNNMQQIDTEELASVMAHVFAKGQFFPGPDEALASVVHEFTGRTDVYRKGTSAQKKGRCTLVTALKRLDGEISVKVAAVIPVEPGTLNMEKPEGFHALLVATLPDFQQVFTKEAYASDSRIIDLIKETTLHHINKKLH